MNKTEALKVVNRKIDQLIINGKGNKANPEYVRLISLHRQLVSK
jgi:hypothetical protein